MEVSRVAKERRTNTSVFNINYHFVWCPKYRKAFMKGKYKEFIETQIEEIAKERKIWVIQKEVMPDYVHLFVSSPPQYAPSNLVKIFKGTIGLRLFKIFPELRREFWGERIWSPSYYCGTAGNVSAEAVKRYIEEQKKAEFILPTSKRVFFRRQP